MWLWMWMEISLVSMSVEITNRAFDKQFRNPFSFSFYQILINIKKNVALVCTSKS